MMDANEFEYKEKLIFNKNNEFMIDADVITKRVYVTEGLYSPKVGYTDKLGTDGLAQHYNHVHENKDDRVPERLDEREEWEAFKTSDPDTGPYLDRDDNYEFKSGTEEYGFGLIDNCLPRSESYFSIQVIDPAAGQTWQARKIHGNRTDCDSFPSESLKGIYMPAKNSLPLQQDPFGDMTQADSKLKEPVKSVLQFLKYTE